MSPSNKIFIHQPDFLPWIGFFQKLKKSSTYVILDDVQFIRRGWINRDQIIVNNQLQWITIPVHSKGKYKELIKNIRINYETDWPKKILKILQHNYSSAPFYDLHIGKLEKIFNKKYEFLIDLNLDLIKYVMNHFKIKTNLILSSKLGAKGHKSEKILNILLNLKSNFYITGLGSKNYLNVEIFNKNNIDIEFFDFENIHYTDTLSDYYLKKISIIDLMLKTNRSL